MEYFIISQDIRIPDIAEPVGISNIVKKDMLNKKGIPELEDLTLQFEVRKKKNIYIDFIERPVPLVSDKMKPILEKYSPSAFFKNVVLNDIGQMRQEAYWLIVPNSIKCLSKSSQFNKDGSVKKLVLDEDKLTKARIFTIDGIMENFIVIRLDVAESLLRRELWGFQLTRVDTERSV